MTKPTKWPVRPAKTQISLGICPVWSESSLCAHWVAKGANFLHADSEDSDQTGRMPRLTWVFAGPFFCFCFMPNFLYCFHRKKSTFSFTRQSSALLERVAVCVSNSEPVLLVGETGTGKTSSVQYLAEQLGKILKIILKSGVPVFHFCASLEVLHV